MNTSIPPNPIPTGTRLYLAGLAGICLLPVTASAELVAWWDFNQPVAYNRTSDVRAGLSARVLAGATISGDGEGRTSAAGDRTARFGIANQRLHLTDASYFTAAAAGNVMSVSYWIKHVATRNATPLSFVAPSVGGRGFQAHTPWSDGTMYFDTGGCCTGGVHRISVNPAATWTTWHHVALVKDGGTKSIYLDGNMRISGANTAPIALNFTELFIGNAQNTTEAVNGDIDDFAVFSHALSASDVLSLAGGTQPDVLATAVTDSDGDGLPDLWEIRYTGGLTTLTSLGSDADGDTLTNAVELARGTNPNNSDSDADGLSDAVETETGTWVSASDTGTSPSIADADGDGLLDGVETNTNTFVNAGNTGTNPFVADTDGDLVNDRMEVLYGSNPVNSASTPITPGIPTLLAWWQFNNNASPTTAADTRAGHVGTFQGAAAYSPDGEGFNGVPGDRALRITATGGKMFLSNASPWINIATRTDKLVVSFWQKVTTVSASSSLWFTSPTAGGGRGFQSHSPYSGNNIYFDTAGCCGANQRINTAVNDVDWTQWHHFVLVKEGVNKRVYINGLQRLSGTGASSLQQDFTSLNIGADAASGSVLGWIDEFAIFAGSLTDQNITDLYDKTKTPAEVASSPDSDGDGLPDLYEFTYFPADLSKLGAAPADFDADGSTDVNEFAKTTNPTNPDTDGDTLFDGVETGTNVWAGVNDRGTNPVNGDTDGDGLSDGVESNSGTYVGASDTGTSPLLADSDSDGFRDRSEILYGSNPTQAGSMPFQPGQSFLLAYWPFNDASNATQALDTRIGIVGNTTGTYSADMGGRSGNPGDLAMCFTPDQSVVADGSFMNLASPADAITISFWQKLNTVRGSSSFWVSSPSAGAVSGFRGLQAHTPWNNNFIYFDHSGCCDPPQRINGPMPSVDVTEWHHFAFVKKGSVKQVYVDGILAVDGTGTAPLVNDFQTLTIGGGPAGYTDGCIDDFAVFAGGLTREQICLITAGESPATVLSIPAGDPFEITATTLLPATNEIRLTWNSTAGCTYLVQSSDDLVNWVPLSGSLAGAPGASSTTITLPLPAGVSRLFIRMLVQ